MYFNALFLIINYVENSSRIYTNIRNFVTAYAASRGNPLFLPHGAMAFLYVTMRKIADAYASTCGFPHY